MFVDVRFLPAVGPVHAPDLFLDAEDVGRQKALEAEIASLVLRESGSFVRE